MIRYVLYAVAAVNLLLFVLMGADKRRAKRGARRIPEATLFFFAVLGGSLGGMAGMVLFRHKTKLAGFRLGFPLIFLCEAGAVLWLVLKQKGMIPL